MLGCGARSVSAIPFPSLPADGSPLVEAGLDGRVPDVIDDGARSDEGPASDVGDAPCNWTVGSMSLVTQLPNDQRVGTPFAVPGGVLIPYANNDFASPDPTRYIQRVDEAGLPIGARQPVLDHAGTFGPMSIANAGETFAAIAWDEHHGCRWVTIDAAGATRSAPRVLSDYSCADLRGRPYGFMEVESSSNQTLVRALDVAGRELSLAGSIADGEWVGALSLVIHPDETIGAAWVTQGPNRIRYAQFDSFGLRMMDPVDIAPVGLNAMTLAMVFTGDHSVMAWQESHDPTDRYRDVYSLTIARNGTVLHAPAVVGRAYPTPGDSELALRLSHGDILMAYVVGDLFTERTFEFQVLNFEGLPRTAPLTVRGQRFVHELGIVETSVGVLATFVTSPRSAPDQVVATPLRCVR